MRWVGSVSKGNVGNLNRGAGRINARGTGYEDDGIDAKGGDFADEEPDLPGNVLCHCYEVRRGGHELSF